MDKNVELRNTLRNLGYDARLVNGNCFDIHQNGLIHYLSNAEGQSLAKTGKNHPLALMDYAEKNGLNYWYAF